MASQNQLSRYGAISRNLDLAPSAKVFLVGDSDDTTYGIQNLAAEFPPDNDGVTRVYSTIQAAVNAASGGRGDVVLVAPGANFSHSRADTWDVADVSIVGMGQGHQRPTMTYDATGADVIVGADGVRVSNLRFVASVDSTDRALRFDTGFSGGMLDNCQFTWDTNGNDFRVMADIGSSYTTVKGNEFLAEDTAGSGKGISIDGGNADYLTIEDNYFYGQFDTVGDTSNAAGPITVDVAHDSGDTVLSGLRVDGNTIVSTDTAAALLINLGNGATTVRGVVQNNHLISYDTAAEDTAQVSGHFGALWLENYFIDADSDNAQSKISGGQQITET